MSELIERLLDEWLRKATSSFTCQECGIQANFIDEIIKALDAKEAENSALRDKLTGIASAITDGITENGQASHRIMVASGTRIEGEFLIGPGADDIRNMLVTIRDLASVPSRLLNKEDRNG